MAKMDRIALINDFISYIGLILIILDGALLDLAPDFSASGSSSLPASPGWLATHSSATRLKTERGITQPPWILAGRSPWR